MADPIKDKDYHWTYSDIKRTPEDERWEIINGVPFDTSPAPTRRHQAVSMRLIRALDSMVSEKDCELYHAPFDIRIPKPQRESELGDNRAANKPDPDETDTVVQPDIVVVCDKTKLDDAGCVGTPELVFEILSPRTSFRDQTDKLTLYEERGVLEYWIVNPDAGWVMVYTRGAPDDRRFAKPDYYRSDESVPVAVLGGRKEGAVIDLGKIFV